jgi:hypothetical protein
MGSLVGAAGAESDGSYGTDGTYKSHRLHKSDPSFVSPHLMTPSRPPADTPLITPFFLSTLALTIRLTFLNLQAV